MGVFATPYPECKPLTTTTTTTTPAPATTVAMNVTGTTPQGPTTTRIVNVTTYTIKSALTMAFGSLPENVTAASLAADTTFVKNVATAISKALGFDVSQVTITKILLAERRLSQAEERRLQGTKLKVEYELVTTDPKQAEAAEATLADPTSAANFASAFSAVLVEEEAASGRTIVVKDIVPEKAVVTSVTETKIIAPTPAPGPGTDPTGPATGPSPGPSPTPAATAAPSPPAEEAEEEESDNGAVIGGVVGGIVGLGVLGAAIYMYKKKSAQE